MKKYAILFALTVLLISCGSKKEVPSNKVNAENKNVAQILKDSNTFLITEISTDKTYGLTPENAVEVGGSKEKEGPRNERRYLNALTRS
ncbi:hypothetical protein [uncultured Winogradskyella sp.]|uniref:hypothetical protein n=1 Tax=uncultured Winogradskyella sp. TaxID=395353 RepID=UPI00261948FA|nr:hypothetical protein [uncultured Winogradskyella sp.]